QVVEHPAAGRRVVERRVRLEGEEQAVAALRRGQGDVEWGALAVEGERREREVGERHPRRGVAEHQGGEPPLLRPGGRLEHQHRLDERRPGGVALRAETLAQELKGEALVLEGVEGGRPCPPEALRNGRLFWMLWGMLWGLAKLAGAVHPHDHRVDEVA